MLLMAPFIAWNVALGPLLPDSFPNDEGVPAALLVIEGITRIGVFAGPVLLSFGWDSGSERLGLVLFGAGLIVYFSSWLPHLREVDWSTSPPISLAPYATPALVLIGIAMATSSWAYAVVSTAFVAAHISHGWIVWHPRW